MSNSPSADTNGRRPLRVGIVGAGFGRRVVAPTFDGIGCEVVDVVSARDTEAVAALCRQDLDLVSVHSPPFLHAEHVQMALEGGHAVLCDKPFGTSTADAEAMVAEAERAGALNLVNFEFRHQPARRKMHQLLQAGVIGRPEHFHYSAYTPGSRVPVRRYGWLFDRSSGGGWVGAFGSHAIDTIRWLLGDIERAGGRSWTTIVERPDGDAAPHRCDAEDAFTAWFELASGCTAVLDTTFTSAIALPPRLTVLGSGGAIENVGDTRVVVRLADGGHEEFGFEPPPGDPHEIAMTAWAREVWAAVDEGRQIEPSFADGLACAEVMDAIRREPPQPVASVAPMNEPQMEGAHR